MCIIAVVVYIFAIIVTITVIINVAAVIIVITHVFLYSAYEVNRYITFLLILFT